MANAPTRTDLRVDPNIDRLIDALALDPGLRARARTEPAHILQVFDMPYAVRLALSSGQQQDPRRVISIAEERAVFAGGYTAGPRCSTDCTKAGCFTQERNCTSQYACSRTGPC